MGFFDLLTPALTQADVWLSAVLPVAVRLTFWALISAVVSLWIFKLLANPEKTSAIKVELKATQKELNNHDGEFSELKQLAVKSLVLSLKRMKMTFFPALVSMLPIIFILVFLSSRFDYQQPVPGDSINYSYTMNPEESIEDVSIQWFNKADNQLSDVLIWPDNDNQLQLMINKQPESLTVPLPLVPVVHKKQWWNVLFANPAGYLSESASISTVKFNFQPLKPGDFFSKYFADWKWPYFIMVLNFSLALIWVFKIKF